MPVVKATAGEVSRRWRPGIGAAVGTQRLARMIDPDEPGAAAYGWKWPLADDEILRPLFALNQARAKG
jgi:hypothetical protein